MPRSRLFVLVLTVVRLAAQDAPPFERIARSHLPADGSGLAVLVARGDELLHRAAYGFAEAAARTPLRVEQPFYVASVAKAVTGACVVDLALRGGIGLDDEVRRHLPELPEVYAGITLRQLLHHRSGIRDFYEIEWIAGRDPGALTAEGVLRLLGRQRATNFAPGSDFLYSNSGYFLLAAIVARKSGRSLRQYAQEHLFGPLDMKHTMFVDDAHPTVDGLPVAHDASAPALAPPRLVGAGGMYSTVDDLRRWLAALDDEAWRPDLRSVLLGAPVLTADQRRSPQLNPYAGGLFVGPIAGEPALTMLGGFGGWQAAAIAFRRAHTAVVVLANGNANALGAARELGLAALGVAEPQRPANDAPPGLSVYRGEDDELLFQATRRSGPSFFTTLGWKVEAARGDGVFRSVDAPTPFAASVGADGVLELRIDGERPRRYRPTTLAKVDAAEAAALAGTWHGDELDGDVVLRADGVRLVVDCTTLMKPIAPFQAVDRDTWISDTGMRLDVDRAADGTVRALRISTSRARGLILERR